MDARITPLRGGPGMTGGVSGNTRETLRQSDDSGVMAAPEKRRGDLKLILPFPDFREHRRGGLAGKSE